MAFSGYLAMTAAEIRVCSDLPKKIAYMACHFSPYGLGLSDLPEQLPPESILMLNDRMPTHRHDPELIASELRQAVENWQCSGVILDFQRSGSPEAAAVAKEVVDTLPCPVCITPEYAHGLTCPVLLPPTPLDTPLDTYLQDYKDRQIWLECACNAQTITVTPSGAVCSPLSQWEPPEKAHQDKKLCCHYVIEAGKDKAVFTLFRTADDLLALMEQARSLGVTCFAGLYQELGKAPL